MNGCHDAHRAAEVIQSGISLNELYETEPNQLNKVLRLIPTIRKLVPRGRSDRLTSHIQSKALIGLALLVRTGLPEKFLVKAPSDGLTGLTDEDNLGFTYHAVNEYVRRGVCDPAIRAQIDQKHRVSRFKFQTLPVYHNGLPMALTDETDYYK